MSDILIIAGFGVIWIVLQLVIFPKLGIPA